MMELNDVLKRVETEAAAFSGAGVRKPQNPKQTLAANTQSTSPFGKPELCMKPLGTEAGLQLPEDPYHRTCHNLLAHLPKPASPLLLLSEDGYSDTVDILGQLFVALAEINEHPVLVIDASGGRLKRHFQGCGRATTLTTRPDNDWQSSITQTNQPGLCLMPLSAGRRSILKADFQSQMGPINLHFGLIIIDGGSVHREILHELTRASAGTLFLLRLGLTSANWAKNTKCQIMAWGGTPVGCITTLPATNAA